MLDLGEQRRRGQDAPTGVGAKGWGRLTPDGATRLFTLIELLVVILIILILAAMLLPALQSAKATAKTAQCIGTLKQWSGVVPMYQGDYDAFIPPALWRRVGTCNTGITNWPWWRFYHFAGYYEPIAGMDSAPDMTNDFYMRLAMNWCPEETELHVDTTRAWQGDNIADNPWAGQQDWELYGSSYALFSRLRPINDSGCDQFSIERDFGRRDGILTETDADGAGGLDIATPDTVPFMGDARHIAAPSIFGHGFGTTTTPFYGLATRHSGGTFYDGPGVANFLLYDGHVESRRSFSINALWTSWPPMANVNYANTTYLPVQQQGITWLYGGFQTQGQYWAAP